MKLSEKQIENSILEYLAMRNIYAFKVKSQGTYDVKEGRFRKPSRYYKRGTADILGVLPGGRFLAIEVKSKTGRLSMHQKMFIEAVNAYGGLGFVARSIEDVEQSIKGVKK